MRRLILLRHAKSSWADPDLPDHERPLNSRGRTAAPVIGHWLQEKGYVPDTVLCSSALRTRETVQRMREAIPDMPEPEIAAELYHASPKQMMSLLAGLPESAACAMFVGHQPGLSAFARMLSKEKVRARCRRAFEHFPTAAAAVLDLPVDAWAAIAPHTADFIDFAKPRELIAA